MRKLIVQVGGILFPRSDVPMLGFKGKAVTHRTIVYKLFHGIRKGINIDFI